jgi:hypothetical protein
MEQLEGKKKSKLAQLKRRYIELIHAMLREIFQTINDIFDALSLDGFSFKGQNNFGGENEITE